MGSFNLPMEGANLVVFYLRPQEDGLLPHYFPGKSET